MRTEFRCPLCNQYLVFATAALKDDQSAPLICEQDVRGFWPAEVALDEPGEADVKADRALWSEVRMGRPEKPGKPADIQQYALDRITAQVKGY